MAGPVPSPEVGALIPHPWCLHDPPPLAGRPLGQLVLLLVDCRQPLPRGAWEPLLASLSPAERECRAALRRPADRQRSLLARAGLRRLLGTWLGCSPAAVPLEAGSHGKPHCPGGPAFNLSHSGELILLAVHPSQPVGVDVERQRPGLDWLAISRRVLPAAEWLALEGLPVEAQPAACLRAWCRLEARLKARGEGFAGLERLRADPRAANVWTVLVPAGYAAAVALEPWP